MSDNLLTPQSGVGAGILHRNSMEFVSRGPWLFVGMTWGDAVDGPADGEPTLPHHRPRGGTCAICSAAIINIVEVKSKSGERATLGPDCAETMWKNQDMPKNLARFKAAQAPREKAKRAAAKVRKLARDAAHNLGTLGDELMQLDRLAACPAGTFERGFGMRVRDEGRAGSQGRHAQGPHAEAGRSPRAAGVVTARRPVAAPQKSACQPGADRRSFGSPARAL